MSNENVPLFWGHGIEQNGFGVDEKIQLRRTRKKVVLVKPGLDSQDGENILKSRIGLESEVVTLEKGETLQGKVENLEEYDVIITNESQFFTENQIEERRLLADGKQMVMCFGLKTDYMSRIFEGSKRLLELADCIRELPTSCRCGRKAVLNLKIENGKVVQKGKQIDLGHEEKYVPVCHSCYRLSMEKAILLNKIVI